MNLLNILLKQKIHYCMARTVNCNFIPALHNFSLYNINGNIKNIDLKDYLDIGSCIFEYNTDNVKTIHMVCVCLNELDSLMLCSACSIDMTIYFKLLVYQSIINQLYIFYWTYQLQISYEMSNCQQHSGFNWSLLIKPNLLLIIFKWKNMFHKHTMWNGYRVGLFVFNNCFV